VMHYEWLGKWPQNRAPVLDSVKIGNQTAYDGISLLPGNTFQAQVWARDPEREKLRYQWEILPEGTEFPYGGNGEKRPPAVAGLIKDSNNSHITFQTPASGGTFRLFVYVYDNDGNWATANIPFYVRK
jgi:hypothetical protein